MLYYFTFIIVSLFFAFLAEKRKKITYAVISMLLISFLCGARGMLVGIDTKYYYDVIRYLDVSWKVSSLDSGFVVVSKFLIGIFKEPSSLIFIYSFFSTFLILTRLWTFFKGQKFTFMMFAYICLFLPLSMNIMRQFISISIVIFSTLFLEKKKYLIFVLFVLIASVFHYSALIASIMVPVAFYFRIKNIKTKRTLLITSIIAIPVFLIILSNLFSNYINKYFGNIVLNIGLMNFFLFFILALYLIVNKDENIVTTNDLVKGNKIDTITDSFVVVMFAIGLFCTFFGYFMKFVDRIGLYFMIFELPFFALCIKKRKYSAVFTIACVVVCLYTFINGLINNGNGVYPYYFFFMEN